MYVSIVRINENLTGFGLWITRLYCILWFSPHQSLWSFSPVHYFTSDLWICSPLSDWTGTSEKLVEFLFNNCFLEQVSGFLLWCGLVPPQRPTELQRLHFNIFLINYQKGEEASGWHFDFIVVWFNLPDIRKRINAILVRNKNIKMCHLNYDGPWYQQVSKGLLYRSQFTLVVFPRSSEGSSLSTFNQKHRRKMIGHRQVAIRYNNIETRLRLLLI